MRGRYGRLMQTDRDTYESRDLVPIGEAAAMLGVSVDTMRRYDKLGKLTAVRTLGGQRRFRRADIDALRSVA